MLGDSKRTGSVPGMTSRAPRSFPVINRTVLAMLNGILRKNEKESAGLGLRIDLSERRVQYQNFWPFIQKMASLAC